MNFQKLRLKYKNFYFTNFQYKIINKDLLISFSFNIDKKIFFTPQTIVKNINAKNLVDKDCKNLDNLIFHLGLIESISYYKSVCCQNIYINCYQINSKQKNYYQNIIINGLGEYFFLNQINFLKDDFLIIHNNLTKKEFIEKYEKRKKIFQKSLKQNLKKFPNQIKDEKKDYLLMLSGGKDSSLSLNFFQKNQLNFATLLVNPNLTTLQINQLNQNSKNESYKKLTFKNNEFKKYLDLKEFPNNTKLSYRQIDFKLLELNSKGFLNGHTPFSAYLAFLGCLNAFIFNFKNVVVSNESSASEETTIYLGKKINHQFSKSYNFEKEFRKYWKKYLPKNVNYFSILRPFNELKIAQKFSTLSQFLPIFKSCNVGQKENIWCHQCPKCLFVFTMLFPFVKEDLLIKKVFKKNLFEDEKLLKIAKELTGLEKNKPFECVGTILETQIAFYLSIKKYKEKTLPIILKKLEPYFTENKNFYENEVRNLLNNYNDQNFIPKNLEPLLKKYFYNS